MALLAPIFVADLIPKDQQLGVRELFDTTPLSKGAYLAGKLVGGWLALLSSLLIVMIAAGIFWFLRAGGLDWGIYLEMWLVGAVALVIINGGLGIILPAPLSTRRRAILAMIALLTVSFFLGNQAVGEDVWSLVRGPIIIHYIGENFETTRPLYLQSIAIGAAQLVLLGSLMWAWMRWRDAKR
jgi:hypothetical protein